MIIMVHEYRLHTVCVLEVEALNAVDVRPMLMTGPPAAGRAAT